MDVVVLAGGFGTRLRPWTLHMPKPLVPILDRAMIQHVVDVLPENLVDRVLIAAGYGIDQMRTHFAALDLPYEVLIVEETEPLGTGGAIANCRPYLSGGTFCVINGDLLTSLSVEKMLNQHVESGSLATISLWEVEDPSRFGVADYDANSCLIRRFQEKPPREEAFSNLINAGTYLIEPELFDRMPSGAFSIERDVYPHVAEDGLLSGFPFDGWFVDAGTPQSYIEAVQTSIANGKFISGKIDGTNWTLSDIDSNVEKSSISEGVSIDSSSIVSNTAILGGCSVDARSILQGCMIGANTMIGSDVELIDVVVDFDAKIPTGHVQKGGTFPQ
ncbi:MAG TPA: NDP-sugar synthase [Candidatus Thalassarchaeaceae archaeon]|nr:NDP-sugar synthase [Candidatus Thalassarchaeaceae archaeon]